MHTPLTPPNYAFVRDALLDTYTEGELRFMLVRVREHDYPLLLVTVGVTFFRGMFRFTVPRVSGEDVEVKISAEGDPTPHLRIVGRPIDEIFDPTAAGFSLCVTVFDVNGEPYRTLAEQEQEASRAGHV